jgi:hypothetical protein
VEMFKWGKSRDRLRRLAADSEAYRYRLSDIETLDLRR